MEDLDFLFAFLGAFGFVFAILVLALYILTSLAIQKMANKLKLENSWLAWIPVGNMFLLGKIAGDKLDLFGIKIDNLSLILLVGTIGSGVLFVVPVIGWILAIAFTFIVIGTYNKIFQIFKPQSATLFTILGVVFGLMPIFLMIASNGEPNITGSGDTDDIEY